MNLEKGNFVPDKLERDLLNEFGENLDEAITIEKQEGNEYVLSSDSIERLVVVVDSELAEIRVLDIEMRSAGRGAGPRVVESLVDVSEEYAFTLYADDVSHNLDQWWRDQGFKPIAPGSADYRYVGKK